MSVERNETASQPKLGRLISNSQSADKSFLVEEGASRLATQHIFDTREKLTPKPKKWKTTGRPVRQEEVDLARRVLGGPNVGLARELLSSRQRLVITDNVVKRRPVTQTWLAEQLHVHVNTIWRAKDDAMAVLAGIDKIPRITF